MGSSISYYKKQPYYLKAFRILLALLWTQYTVLDFVRVVISKIPYFGFLSDLFIPTCIALALIISLPWFVKNIRGIDVLFYIGIVVLVLVTMISFPNNSEFISENWWTLLVSSAGFYFVGLSYSHSTCSRDLFFCSAGGVLIVFVYQLYKLSNGVVLEEDNMYVAYNLLPSVMYLIYYAIYKNKKKYWLIALASIGVMFIFGTRGPILCAIVFISLYVLHKTIVSNNIKNYLLLLSLAIVLVIFLVNENLLLEIVSYISSIFGRLGFSTRIFDFFVAGDATLSLGREYLREQVITAIINEPIVGYGFTGDQYLLGVYCHNLFFELWCHFGVIIGSVILIALFSLSIIALIRSADNRKIFYLALMLISMVYVKLMLSSSYTIEPYFYFMIGVFVGIKRKCIPLNDIKIIGKDD